MSQIVVQAIEALLITIILISLNNNEIIKGVLNFSVSHAQEWPEVQRNSTSMFNPPKKSGFPGTFAKW